MKKIIYYITDHGMGHATRSIAIIRELQKLNIEILVRNSNVAEFLHKSLPGTSIKKGLTDVGPILNPDCISIDKDKSKTKIIDWINKLESYSDQEGELLKKEKPNMVISDISPMPIIAAKSNNIPCVTISNFSWYDVLNFLPTEFRDRLRTFYEYVDLAIQLPLGTPMEHFKRKKKVNLIARIPNQNPDKIKEEFEIDIARPCVLFALGGSNNQIRCTCEDNVQIISMNTKMNNSISVLDLSNYIEGQDLVSISNLVICKCGYGIISECLTNGIPFFHVADNSHPEQLAIHKELIKRGYDNRITFDKINELHISSKFLKELSRVSREPIDIDNTINYMLEFIKS